jgi:hypothetical protein
MKCDGCGRYEGPDEKLITLCSNCDGSKAALSAEAALTEKAIECKREECKWYNDGWAWGECQRHAPIAVPNPEYEGYKGCGTKPIILTEYPVALCPCGDKEGASSTLELQDDNMRLRKALIDIVTVFEKERKLTENDSGLIIKASHAIEGIVL